MQLSPTTLNFVLRDLAYVTGTPRLSLDSTVSLRGETSAMIMVVVGRHLSTDLRKQDVEDIHECTVAELIDLAKKKAEGTKVYRAPVPHFADVLAAAERQRSIVIPPKPEAEKSDTVEK